MTMTIPFLSFFKKVKDQALARKDQLAPAPKSAAPLEKPSSERFSKTVMPNATRTLAPQDPFEMAARSSAMAGPSAPSAQRTVAFGGTAPAAGRQRELPPAVALALEPRVERVISLNLADVAPQISADYIKPIESIDGTRRILLKASEVERGMANGKPAVSLATIYQQVPEIFLRSIASGDEAQVQLPFEKVLEQFSKLKVRNDQERHQAVPQVETPFLQVTLEDNSRFGTTIEAVETNDLPPVRVEPPTAEAFAAAEPEGAGNGFIRCPASDSAAAMPTRIPFKLSPNGTGGPAPESVPASSGPSVPTPSAPPPTRIPFKITAPSNDLRTQDEPWLTAESLTPSDQPPITAAPAPPTPITAPVESKAEIMISLPLKPIMQGLPPFQISGNAGSVPAEAQVELPFSLIEPQLASGRIAITPEAFAAGLPSEFQSFFKKGEAGDVILPLHEVLKNLPSASLRMRDDQEVQDAGAHFATPFSAKAEEDAKRFKVAGPAVAPPIPAPEPLALEAVAEAPAAPTVPAPKPFALEAVAEAPSFPTIPAPVTPVVPAVDIKSLDSVPRNPLQVALDTDAKLDAKGVVAEVNRLAGIKACAFMFGDGLSLAGSLPPEYETDGLCAMAPSLMQRIENHMVETKLGALRGMTLTCLKGAVTFFMHENLCLAALHSGGDLTTEVRDKLSRIVHELSRKYSHHPV
jgi:predicted regulator of Ras-like GTPase activity (Roadblock/LC7/MglB family)